MSPRFSALCLAALALVACKGGLNTDQGNDFPCDFSQSEGVRDSACAKGDVCGVDNLCKRYRYEGPQFDNGASAPRFDAPRLTHPLVLTEPVMALARGFSDAGVHAIAITGSGSRTGVALIQLGRSLTVDRRDLAIASEAITALGVANSDSPSTALTLVLLGLPDGTTRSLFFGATDLDAGKLLDPGGDGVRNGRNRLGLVRHPRSDGGVVDIGRDGGGEQFDFFEDGGPLERRRVADVRYLPGFGSTRSDVLLVTPQGLFLDRSSDGGAPLRLSAPDEPMPEVLTTRPARVHLRHDPSGTLAAFTSTPDDAAIVLSTWRLDRGPTPSALRAWSDCRPCTIGRISAFAPTLEGGSPVVEVLCSMGEGPQSLLSLVRVTGSAAADERQPCVLEQLEAPFALRQVVEVSGGRRRVEGLKPIAAFDESFGSGVAIGGKRGQIWVGPTFSSALPLFLERLPTAFGTLPSRTGAPLPAVLTDRYAAVLREPAYGYETFSLGQFGAVPEGAVAGAFIGEALGWAVTTSAHLIRLDPFAEMGERLTFGPRLLDARGAPARSPFLGEAVTAVDGGIVSFVLTADDSLYFTPAPTRTSGAADQLDPITPQLTPAPSSPIRSFALERSAVGTDGVNRVRGYLVAGRSLFVVTLAGAPPRWSATPIVLQSGEPLETWMDHPLGGLGRVGYRDGQVFTLPGGFLLVNELPRDAGTKPPQVIDYENLGGWPVAMTSNGLYEAHYDVLDGGRLANRFEDGGINRAMEWRRVTLPDGGEPWLKFPVSRLHVTRTVEPYDGGQGLLFPPYPPGLTAKVYRLDVFAEDQVIEVGTLLRR